MVVGVDITVAVTRTEHMAAGVAGLADRHGGGVARRLSAEQEAEVAGWMRAGPDLESDKVVRRRCADIQARIAELFGVSLRHATNAAMFRKSWTKAAYSRALLSSSGRRRR